MLKHPSAILREPPMSPILCDRSAGRALLVERWTGWSGGEFRDQGSMLLLDADVLGSMSDVEV